jgi:hypothetical protein
MLLTASFAGAATAPEQLVSREQLAQVVGVRDVTTSADGRVAGTVVNLAPYPVRDVRLRIDHLWLWDNEFHPGVDDYSRSEDYMIPGEIPPGGSRAFMYRPSAPLETGAAGHFTPVVEPLAVTEMVEPGVAVNARSRAASPYGGARPSDVPPPPAAEPGGTITDEPIRPPY